MGIHLCKVRLSTFTRVRPTVYDRVAFALVCTQADFRFTAIMCEPYKEMSGHRSCNNSGSIIGWQKPYLVEPSFISEGAYRIYANTSPISMR